MISIFFRVIAAYLHGKSLLTGNVMLPKCTQAAAIGGRSGERKRGENKRKRGCCCPDKIGMWHARLQRMRRGRTQAPKPGDTSRQAGSEGHHRSRRPMMAARLQPPQAKAVMPGLLIPTQLSAFDRAAVFGMLAQGLSSRNQVGACCGCP